MPEVIPPRHLGFIVDGNRRWARKHGLPVYEGHLAGYNTLKDVIIDCADSGVEYISLYTFSTENWKRAKEEVRNLMGLMMRLFKTDLKIMIDNDLRLLVAGSQDRLPPKMIAAIEKAQELTAHCTRATVVVCFNYGGQQEIVDAMRSMSEAGIEGDAITIEAINEHLYQPEVPPVDLIVRTSGEQRLSNFMLWRSPYSEILFFDKLFPDMKKADIIKIIREYSNRTRRFGR